MEFSATLISFGQQYPWILWVGFSAFIIILLLVDLKIVHKKNVDVSIRESIIWSVVWISLGLGFGGIVAFVAGAEKAMQYFSGFILEKSLSVDNIFVFVMIFAFLGISTRLQHKVLFWGVLGAIGMRVIAILSGNALLKNFHWAIYLFGAVLIITAVKMLWMEYSKGNGSKNQLLLFLKRVLPVSENANAETFYVREHGKFLFTPMAIALVAIEISDVIFAIDSIPAIFAITDDPFIVYTSNIFAILGLRSLFFLSNHLVQKLRYLTYGVATTLIFVGIKMLLVDFYKISTAVSLGVIACILGIAAFISILAERRSA